MIVRVLGRISTAGRDNLDASKMGGALHKNEDTGESPRIHDTDVGDDEYTEDVPVDVGIYNAARRPSTSTRGRF